MQEGGKNTIFFHNLVIHNRHNSNIHKLKKEDGNQVEIRREIEEEPTHHFEDILTEDKGDRGQDIARITRLIPKVVTRENNEMILKTISMQEMEEVVNQMAMGMTQGLDGFTTIFFHLFWDLIKE